MTVKFENQSKRKFLPVCWTRANSVEVEDEEHTVLLSLEVLNEGSERRGRGRIGARQLKIRLSSEPQFSVFWFFAFNAVLFSACSSKLNLGKDNFQFFCLLKEEPYLHSDFFRSYILYQCI